MKKVLAFVMVLVVCLSLCACGKSEAVKNVENLISSIGSVTFSSSAAIKEAEEAYYALSDEEQTKVKNYSELEKAKKDFEALGIQLTIDNYEKYLNVSMTPHLFGAWDFGRMMGSDSDIDSYVYTGIESNVSVSGKSSNYDYNDVKVTVKYTGFYVPCTSDIMKQINRGQQTIEGYFLDEDNMVDVDFTLTATTDIIGSGFASSQIELPDDYWVMDSSVSITYEIVDVSGVLTK